MSKGCLRDLKSSLIQELYKVNISDDEFLETQREINSAIYDMFMNTIIKFEDKDISEITPSQFNNHSGGAEGADVTFDKIGKELGFSSHNHYYFGKITEDNSPNGTHEISYSIAREGAKKVALAAKRNWGYDRTAMSDSRLIRNWAQVKNASAIYAISNIVGIGQNVFPDQKNDDRKAIAPSVTGGTGYAVGMAILEDKPVYVYNMNNDISEPQYEEGWYVYNKEKDDFVLLSEPPMLTQNYAGIGSRNLTENGEKAIRDLYENTLIQTKVIEDVNKKSNTSGSGPKSWVKDDVATLVSLPNQDVASFVETIVTEFGNSARRTQNAGYHNTIMSLLASIQNVLADKLVKKELNFMMVQANDKYTNARFTHGNDEVVTQLENGVHQVNSSDTLELRLASDVNTSDVDPDNQNTFRDDYTNGLQGARELLVHDMIHGMIDNAMRYNKELYAKAAAVQKQFAKFITVDNMIQSIKDSSGHDVTVAQIEQLRDIERYINGSPIEFMMYSLTNPFVYDIMEKEGVGKPVEYNLIEPGDRVTRDKRTPKSRFRALMDKLVDIINSVYRSIKIGSKSGANGKIEPLNGLDVLKSIVLDAMKQDIDLLGETQDNKQRQVEDSYYTDMTIGDYNLSTKSKKFDDKLKQYKDDIFASIVKGGDKLKVENKIERFGSFMNQFQFIRDSKEKGRFRLFSDVINTIVEDTTSRKGGAAEFYQLVREIQGSRDRNKVKMVQVAREMLDKEWVDIDKDTRASATLILKNDWRATGLDLDGYAELLADSSKLDAEIEALKTEIGQTEYNENAKYLGYYMTHGVSKAPELMKNAEMIVVRAYGSEYRAPLVHPNLVKETIGKVDKLATLYSMKYMEQKDKDNIVSLIGVDKDLVEATSNMYYSYQDEQRAKFAEVGFDRYIPKGYVRKSSEVNMKFEILKEPDIRKGKYTAHEIIRKEESINDIIGNTDDYYLVVSRDYDTSRTQGGFDDIHLIDKEMGVRDLYDGTEKDLINRIINNNGVFRETSNARAKMLAKRLSTATSDDVNDMAMRKNELVASYDVNGNVVDYEIPISDAVKRMYGRQIDDIANTLAHTISHTDSKEHAIANNKKFAEMLLKESIENEGKEGYVLLRPSTVLEVNSGNRYKYDEEWAMIPRYIQDAILNRDNNGKAARDGLWVKEGRINNIIGYKDPSIANLKLFGKDLSDHPEMKRAIQILEHYWKNLSSMYKAVIVKYFPKVIWGNMSSNMWVAMRHGIGPIEYAKAFIRHWNHLSSYLDINDEILELELRDRGGQNNSDRIEALKEKQKSNPFHRLIEDGQFSTIMEDIDLTGMTKKTHMEDYRDQFLSKFDRIGNETKELAGNIYGTRGSFANKQIEKLTVYNDIINRSIIMEKMMQDLDTVQFSNESDREAKIQDILNYVDMLFVNYGYRDNKYLKYANDVNFVMFTKYFFRALKANVAMASRYPLGTIGYESFDSFVFDLSDSVDQYMSPIDTVSKKFVVDPVEMFWGTITPHTAHFF